MMNNKDNITNDNTITNIFIGLFQYFYLLELFVFAYSLILSGLKVKNCLKINILIIKNYEINYKMDIEPLQIKNCDNTITPLYLVINCLFGFIEQTERSSDRYLVVSINNEIIISIFNKLWKFIENKIISDDSNNKIKQYYKLRFDSDLYLPTKL